ncbi:MAG: cyclase family protein [Candidatus Bathyarchaeia archaeon]
MKVIDLTQAFSLDLLVHTPHSGTHVDAPAYLFRNGKTIDQFGPDALFKDAVLLDLTHTKPGEQIDDEDLEAAEEEAGVGVREGEAVILYTGWGDAEQNDQQYPFLSANGAEYLEFKRVGAVGVDTPNLDDPLDKGSPAHTVLLRSGILVLEELCNLDLIETERFRLIALPLRIGLACSPVRAVAVVD